MQNVKINNRTTSTFFVVPPKPMARLFRTFRLLFSLLIVVGRACRLPKQLLRSSKCGRACRLLVVGRRWTFHAISEIDRDPVSQHPYPADCCGADELSSYDLGARRAEEHSKSR